MLPNGKVEVEGYGPGFAFSPVKLLPHDAGIALEIELSSLKQEHDSWERSQRRTWNAKASKLRSKIEQGEP